MSEIKNTPYVSDNKSVELKLTDFDYSYQQDDLMLVGDALIDEKGLISQHLESANNFYENGIRQIITQGFKIEREIVNRRSATAEDKEIEWIHCEVIPTNVTLTRPDTFLFTTGKRKLLLPTQALVQEKFYSGGLSFSCKVKATAHLKNGSTLERTDDVKSFQISKVPIIKGSIMCNTYNQSKEALMKMGEDPSDAGGYFVVRGEWAVDCTENIKYNDPRIYINEGYGKSRARCEYISKPGDTYQNSDMLLIRFFNDNTLTIEIARDKLSKVQIPFYMLFRAMGWSSDKDMMDWIVYDYDNDANKHLLNYLIEAMNAKYAKVNYKDIYDQMAVIKGIVDMVPEDMFKRYELKTKPENYHNAIKDVLRIFDVHCLPHIGMTSDARHEKLKYLALLIRKLILVWLRHIPQTDRDSYRNKRIHAAGENYAKTFKTYFNQTVVMPIKRRMIKDFNSSTFSQVNLSNLVKSAIYAEEFERLIVQTIISGTKSSLKIKRKTVVNRLGTQLLNRKNQLNVLATMRQISATNADSAKQSARASEMRRVHMSQVGYVCVAHSPPEGEKVGINKQMAIYNFIAPASSSEVLKRLLLDDDDIIKDDGKLTPMRIFNDNLARVYVNGHLMGYTEDSIHVVNKYRQKRRRLEINPYTTVYWDNVQDEVHFYVDVGRSCRVMMIVYNNKRDKALFGNSEQVKSNTPNDESKSKAKRGGKSRKKKVGANEPFKQGLAITVNDISLMYQGKKTLDDLLREQKIEYVTAEEQENYYLCPNFDQLSKDRNNELKEYTHCDIPQAILGITALTTPFGNHNQAPRVTYQTAQAKQTCGYYALNWPFRIDKETFLQYVNEKPLVLTAANKYLFPNGNNVMVAIACYTGYNQEDSLIINKAAIERGLFDGSKFTYYKTDLEQKEELGNPDASKTDGLKSANYEKLVNGVVQPGTHLQADDVIVGKYMPIPKGKDEKYLYIDRSLTYKHQEEAIVQRSLVERNEDGTKFAKVSLRKIRPVATGDKFCKLPQSEVLTNQGWIQLKDLDITKAKVATMDPQTFELKYVYATEKYEFDYDSKVDGKMYHLKSQQLYMVCTPNHKNFIKPREHKTPKPFQFVKAKDMAGKRVRFKKDCVNNQREATYINLKDDDGNNHRYPINSYLKLLGMFISDGWVKDTSIMLSMKKQRKVDYVNQIANDLNKSFTYLNNAYKFCIGRRTLPGIYEQFKTLSVGALNKHLPKNIWKLGQENCRALLDGLMNGDGNINSNNSWGYWTSSQVLADEVQRLALHAGYSACITIGHPAGQETFIRGRSIKSVNDCYSVRIVKSKNEPQINHGHVHQQKIQDEKFIDYVGKVMCIEVPETHLFYCREDKLSPPCWTGNSSRSGYF